MVYFIIWFIAKLSNIFTAQCNENITLLLLYCTVKIAEINNYMVY